MASSVQAARQDAGGWKATSIGPTLFNAPAVAAVSSVRFGCLVCQGCASLFSLPTTMTISVLLRAADLVDTLRDLWP